MTWVRDGGGDGRGVRGGCREVGVWGDGVWRGGERDSEGAGGRGIFFRFYQVLLVAVVIR